MNEQPWNPRHPRVAKLQQRLRREVGKAIAEFNMIEDGDRVMVCLSGGKDSYALLDILQNLQRKAPVAFSITAVHLDQKQPGYPPEILPAYLRSANVEHHIIEQDTYAIVKDKIPAGHTMCGLCSRLRRGILYSHASRHGFTKIALGHHRDDIVETLFLNMFFGSKLSTMPPKLLSDDQQHVVIRPLAFCREKDIASYAKARDFPIIPCNLCGSQDHLQRVKIKQMLAAWEKEQPGRVDNIFRAVTNVEPSHLADSDLFDFKTLASRSDIKPSCEAWLNVG